MNLIPKINGRIRTGEGTLIVTLPLTYQGTCDQPDEFSLQAAREEAVLTFFSDEAVPAEGYRLQIDEGGIALTSSDSAGQYYGLITLKKLISESEGKLT